MVRYGSLGCMLIKADLIVNMSLLMMALGQSNTKMNLMTLGLGAGHMSSVFPGRQLQSKEAKSQVLDRAADPSKQEEPLGPQHCRMYQVGTSLQLSRQYSRLQHHEARCFFGTAPIPHWRPHPRLRHGQSIPAPSVTPRRSHRPRATKLTGAAGRAERPARPCGARV